MYNSNKLAKQAYNIRNLYKDVDLDSEYKTELFRSYLYAGTKNLEEAAQLLGGTYVPDNGDSRNWIKILFVVTITMFISLAISYALFWRAYL